MNIFQAIILGIVQGLTEFLPISSSAHLFLIPKIFNWEYQGLGFDVALHWGTLLSVLIIFGQDYIKYIKAILASLFRPPAAVASGQTLEHQATTRDKQLGWYLVLATVPAAFFGFFFESQLETTFRNPWIVVAMLMVFALLLWIADNSVRASDDSGTSQLTWGKSFAIGLSQALALVPGVSRSGVTITAGIFAGLSRKSAARFSFLLLGPIAFGAGLVTLPDLDIVTSELIVSFIASAVSGYLAIKFLLRYVATRSYKIFVWYRIAFALLVAVTLLIK